MEGCIMATYVKTNAVTKPILNKIKNRVNRTGLMVIIAYKNKDIWLSVGDFKREAARDGVLIPRNTLFFMLATLSGLRFDIMPAYRRNELIRKPVTDKDRIKYGWDERVKHQYKFNIRGTIRIKGALGFARIEN